MQSLKLTAVDHVVRTFRVFLARGTTKLRFVAFSRIDLVKGSSVAEKSGWPAAAVMVVVVAAVVDGMAMGDLNKSLPVIDDDLAVPALLPNEKMTTLAFVDGVCSGI
jgi:hypothetical protein